MAQEGGSIGCTTASCGDLIMENFCHRRRRRYVTTVDTHLFRTMFVESPHSTLRPVPLSGCPPRTATPWMGLTVFIAKDDCSWQFRTERHLSALSRSHSTRQCRRLLRRASSKGRRLLSANPRTAYL